MSNYEHKLLRYIQGHQVQTASLAKTTQQCGEAFLRDPSLSKWLESLPWIVRFANSSYVIHAGIRPDRPIDKQRTDYCIYMRTWNPKTKKISNEGIDPWWYEYPSLFFTEAPFCSFDKDLLWALTT